MRKLHFTIISVLLVLSATYGYEGTYRIYTKKGWSVERVSPSPSGLRSAAAMPTGNIWDISVSPIFH